MKVYFDARDGPGDPEPDELRCDRVEEGESGIFLLHQDEAAMYEERQIGYIPYGRLFYVGPDDE